MFTSLSSLSIIYSWPLLFLQNNVQSSYTLFYYFHNTVFLRVTYNVRMKGHTGKELIAAAILAQAGWLLVSDYIDTAEEAFSRDSCMEDRKKEIDWFCFTRCSLTHLSAETKEAKMLLVPGVVREIKPLLVQLQKLPIVDTEQSIRNSLSLLLFLSLWVLWLNLCAG